MQGAERWLHRNEGCEVRKGSYGFGLFATRDFHQGDVILEEHPAMLCLPTAPSTAPASLRSLDMCSEIPLDLWVPALHVVYPCDETCPRGIVSLDSLLADFSMYAPRQSVAARRFETALSSITDLSAEAKDRLLDALLMLKFTSFSLRGEWAGGRCIFVVLGKTNHSCFPNCGVLHKGSPPDDETQLDDLQRLSSKGTATQLRAITSISSGDELTWSYPGPGFAIKVASAEARREKLRNGFEFDCSCPLCEPRGMDRPSHGQLCKRAIAWGKVPPIPKGGFPLPPWRKSKAAESCAG